MSDLIKQWQEDKTKNKSRSKEILDKIQFDNNIAFDETIKTISNDVANKIDCLSCANCCKTTVTTFTEEDINRASNYLGMSKKLFKSQYLISDQDEYTTINTPCPFLLQDNKCKIYDARPHACSSFPHLNRKKFFNRKKAHIENYTICPIVYHTLENIKLLYQ
jgi:hypothetical protein